MKIVLTAKRAIVIAVSVPLIATGTFVTEAPISFAQTETTFTESVTGEVPRQVDLGSGTINPIQPVVQGDVMTISGTGFTPRTSEGRFYHLSLTTELIFALKTIRLAPTLLK
ncbi:hypothetical protein [Corynebacterium cystitidis]|uniref:hypothetical protein n=1 Tax=Corynebacterium cystitidis TaxID=35757 RepID=UPI00211EE33F|nr:hypothetical protein [Corynebacterium cystitidis]